MARPGLALSLVIEQARFGRTGHSSTRVIFGGAALGSASQETADGVLEVLREHGVNHLDTAASYGDSELRIAPWLVGHRDDYFLATKTGERNGEAARAELEASLSRLGVDHVDLVQLHNLVEEQDWEAAHAPDGALAALCRARDEGLVRFIGVTGHGVSIPRMHLRSLERFDYDSVLLPYNFTMRANKRYHDEVEQLLTVCHERDVAVQTIKAVAAAAGRRIRPAKGGAGTNRSTIPVPSPAPCTTCSEGRGSSSTLRAISTCSATSSKPPRTRHRCRRTTRWGTTSAPSASCNCSTTLSPSSSDTRTRQTASPQAVLLVWHSCLGSDRHVLGATCG